MPPLAINQGEFRAHPLCLEVTFRFISFLHRVWTLVDLALGSAWYHYIALCSSESHTFVGLFGWVRCWLLEASRLLQLMDISLVAFPLLSII